MWKEKVAKLQQQQARDELARKNQESKITSVQEENKMYQEQIEEIRRTKNLGQEDVDDGKAEKREAELQRLLNEKKVLQEKSLQ